MENKQYENETILAYIELNCKVKIESEPYEKWDKTHEYLYFTINKLPKWIFAIFNHGDKKYVFGQEKTTIDKFKPSRSAYCIELSLHSYDNRYFDSIYEMINSIRKHPLIAYYNSQIEYNSYCDLGLFGLVKFYLIGKADYLIWEFKKREIKELIKLVLLSIKIWLINPSFLYFRIKDKWKGERFVSSGRWKLKLYLSKRISKMNDDEFEKYIVKYKKELGSYHISYYIRGWEG